MSIVLNGTTGITTPDITSSGSLNIDASAPDDSVVVDASGNVGIGTSSPVDRVDIGSGRFAASSDTATPTGGSAYFYKQSTGATVSGYQVILETGSAGSRAERARIDSSGNLLVGTTASRTGVYSLTLEPGNSYFMMRAAGTSSLSQVAFIRNTAGTPVQVGDINTNGSSTTFNTSSDYRLKNTIAPMTGALAKVALLKPCTYKWNVDDSDGEGFIAHELAEVVPQCVTGEKDAVDEEGKPQYQGIDTSFLVATLTAAIQEQQAIINEQKAALDVLTARVSALEAANV
jgi:hypothetical protein